MSRSNWKPSDAEVDAACAEFQRRYPLTGFGREWPDVMRKILIEAHDAAPEPDTTEFEAAVEAYCDARELFDGRTSAMSFWPTHIDDPKAERTKQQGLIAEALDEKRAAFDRLIAMYKERR